MNIVLDNIVFYLQNAGGISVYWYELLKRITENDVNYTIIENKKKSTNIFRKELNLKEENIITTNIPVYIERYLPVQNPNEDFGIFHSSYYRISADKKKANIVTVHDFIYEYFKKGISKIVHSKQKLYALENADGIICISENTKNDLLNLFPKISNKSIKVIYHGISQEFYYIDKKKEITIPDKLREIIENKFILYVGGRGKYKNYEMVIDILEQKREYKLVIIGGGDLTKSEIEILKTKKIDYKHISNLDNYQLNILYNFAFCLLYPSSYEGFGIPIIEAMKTGCPVITTDQGSIPEVCGNGGIMIKELKPEQFIIAINYLNIPTNRTEMINKGFEQAKKFSWDKCYMETMAYYNEVYSKKFKH